MLRLVVSYRPFAIEMSLVQRRCVVKRKSDLKHARKNGSE
jgi:hypothetical protein